MMYYLYRHIRTDTQQPFYIGIGKRQEGKEVKTEYKRAFSKSGRNRYWKNIVNKIKYEVEILFESDNMDVINEKEKEFISIYGRTEFGGLLCNMTDGGDGTNNMSQESKNKISKALTGIKRTKEQRRAQSERQRGKKLSLSHIEKIRKCRIGWVFSPETIGKMKMSAKGKHYKNTNNFRIAATKRNGRAIICIDSGVIYSSCRKAIREIWGIDTNALSNALRVFNGRYRGKIFKFLE